MAQSWRPRTLSKDDRRAAEFENRAEIGDVRIRRDMRCARVLGHDDPLNAHELKNATTQGNLSEASWLVQLHLSAFDIATSPQATIKPSTAVCLLFAGFHLIPSRLVKGVSTLPLAYCALDLGRQQDVFDSGLSDALSMVTCDGMQGSKYLLRYVMGDKDLLTTLYTPAATVTLRRFVYAVVATTKPHSAPAKDLVNRGVAPSTSAGVVSAVSRLPKVLVRPLGTKWWLFRTRVVAQRAVSLQPSTSTLLLRDTLLRRRPTLSRRKGSVAESTAFLWVLWVLRDVWSSAVLRADGFGEEATLYATQLLTEGCSRLPEQTANGQARLVLDEVDRHSPTPAIDS
ncbi:hypothetical protein BU25DRAFT_423508 [Macroventuria anomochaeta]|uniref:Uncharacterized protein n=1 Tax=Macroventuria anomochaeta TaxID=301207 RepID=A0ACB6RVE3_9PLEO|nr:uncharacterized protein BU25DRAFT_423508 [Macroventuria anomochaeta]KAF2625073.1 hypothetical protein BU25DRAFT_423508 [Macroventuria anomochaeta]